MILSPCAKAHYIKTFLCKHCSMHTQKHGYILVLKQTYSFWFSSNGNGLQKAISTAEQVVGYPTSFSSLKYLVDEEPANFVNLAKKLVGSGHPLLKTARDLLSQDPYSSHQLGGLWVLLISKAARSLKDTKIDHDIVNGIHRKQRMLAETTELINTAFLLHRSMLSLNNDEYLLDLNKKTLNFGNKLSVLGGDFLLAKASLKLAKLENTHVVELIGKAIGNMAEGSTFMDTDEEWTLKDWQKYVFLLKGSLIANSCEAATVIIDQSDEKHEKKQRLKMPKPRETFKKHCQADIKKHMLKREITFKIRQGAFDFGRNLVLAQQCDEDIEVFQNKKRILKKTNFLFIFALQMSNDLKKKVHELPSWQTNNLNYSKDLKETILLLCPNIIEEAKRKCEMYITTCKQSLSLFEQKEAVDAINGILKTLCET